MEDYASSDEDYHYDSDQDDSVEAYENDEDYALLSSKGPTTKVFASDRIHRSWDNPNFLFYLFLSLKPSLVGFPPLAIICVRVCVSVFFSCIGL